MSGRQRIVNFEIMRTIAMFFIVLWHACVHGLTGGGIFCLEATSSLFNCISTTLICSLTGVAVNLYVMITGYFMISKKEFHIRRFETTWLHTMFYALGFPLAAFVMSPDFAHIKIIAEPLCGNTGYWFVNKYLGLVLIAPFLARLASILSRRSYQLLLLVLGIINISVYAPFTTIMGEVWHGVSLQWFVFLFFVAGYIRKYKPLFGSKKILPLFLLTWVINFVYVICERYLTNSLATPIPYLPYNGIIFFESFFLFLFFRDHQFNSLIWKPFVALAPYTFGIYLIHENHFVSYLLWQGAYSPMHLINSWYLIPYLIIMSFGIFLICAILEYIRDYIFNHLRLDNILTKFNIFLYTRLSIHLDF